MLKTDLHMHTNYIQKDEGNYHPRVLINNLARLGYNVIAITEHEMFKGKFYNGLRTYYHFKDYARKKGLLMIPGIETYIERREVLLINFTGDVRKYKTFDDLRELKKKENVLIIAPHPFYYKSQCVGRDLVKNIDVFDAVEHSSFYNKFFNKPNEKAIKTAREFNKPLVGNSDAHRLIQLNSNYTLIDSESKKEDVLEAIRKNKVKLITRPMNMTTYSKIFSMAVWMTIKKEII